jgi:hypothetical protein
MQRDWRRKDGHPATFAAVMINLCQCSEWHPWIVDGSQPTQTDIVKVGELLTLLEQNRLELYALDARSDPLVGGKNPGRTFGGCELAVVRVGGDGIGFGCIIAPWIGR